MKHLSNLRSAFLVEPLEARLVLSVGNPLSAVADAWYWDGDIAGKPDAMVVYEFLPLSSVDANRRAGHVGRVDEGGDKLVLRTRRDNLVDDDANGVDDVFVLLTESGDVERISVGSDGGELSGGGFGWLLSGNGRFAVYETKSNPFDAEVAEGDVVRSYVIDLETGDIDRVMSDETLLSFGAKYETVHGISYDGQRLMVQLRSADGAYDAVVVDRASGEIVEFNAWSSLAGFSPTGVYARSISGDGQVAAVTFVDGDGRGVLVIGDIDDPSSATIITQWEPDPFGRDVAVSDMSRDGRYVLLEGLNTGLRSGKILHNTVDAFLYDRLTEEIQPVAIDAPGQREGSWFYRSEISSDGRFVLLSGGYVDTPDDNTQADFYLFDRVNNQTVRLLDELPVIALGGQALSGDGSQIFIQMYEIGVGPQAIISIANPFWAGEASSSESSEIVVKEFVLPVEPTIVSIPVGMQSLLARQFVTLDLGALDLLGRDGPVRLVPVVF